MKNLPSKTSSAVDTENTAHGELESNLLSTAQVAKLWGVSRVTVDRERLAGNLTGIPHNNGFVYRRAEVIEVGSVRAEPSGPAAKELQDGARDARVFSAFQEGLAIGATVIRERVSVVIVSRLRAAWEQAREAARKDTVCMHQHDELPCNGPPQPQNTLCNMHAAHSRVVSDEQLLVLNGTEIPTALRCSSCSGITSRGICSACLTAVTVRVEGTEHGRRIVIRALEKVIAIISPDAASALAHQLIKSPVKEPDATASKAHSTVPLPQGEELGALIQELKKVHNEG